jgi:hypothetical protein
VHVSRYKKGKIVCLCLTAHQPNKAVLCLPRRYIDKTIQIDFSKEIKELYSCMYKCDDIGR